MLPLSSASSLPTADCPLPTSSYAAIAALPGMLVPTGLAAGPVCLRLLNQNALNQTRLPGAVPAGNVTSTSGPAEAPRGGTIGKPSLVADFAGKSAWRVRAGKFRKPAGTSVSQQDVPAASKKFPQPSGRSRSHQEVPAASRKFR